MTFCKTVLLFSLSFGLTNAAFAQVTKPAPLQQNVTSNKQMVDQAILAIRQDVQKINSKPLKKEHYTYESAGCTEDGVVNYYFDGKAIVKIVESGSIGDGSWVNEYYYRSGKVIFCFETIIGGPAIGKVTKTEYRFYVKDGIPLKTMEGAKTVKSDSKASESIGTAGSIFEAYTSKDFAGALCN
ncbi:hypothetical protein [Pedobacter sp. KBS0701]|uniref:hypothetical protein n=1 Tax=unclassified Pedobacter TaxID=2628915 RepID=UPI00110E7EA2|nr:hypothetical protein [Pedobacter sp. KBS0701]QDW25624.1 hypothetical protein FFJ24_012680 [Pedobacter sp. KBS0701]